jgi:hypothetical protein
MIGYPQGLMKVPIISLCLKPRKILKIDLVILAAKIALSNFFLKQILLDFLDFTFVEHSVRVYLHRCGLLIIVFNFGAAHKPRICIIYKSAAHLLLKLLLFWWNDWGLWLWLLLWLLFLTLLTIIFAANQALQTPLDIIVIVGRRIRLENVTRLLILQMILYLILFIIAVNYWLYAVKIIFIICMRCVC